MQIIHSIKSGIKELDELTGGFFPDELTIVAARPDIGKTTVMLSVIQNLILNHAAKPVLFSLEMSNTCVMKILISMLSGVPLKEIRNGAVQKPNALNEAEKILENSDLIIDDTSGIQIDELCKRIRLYVREKGMNIIFIDYLSLIQTLSNDVPIFEQVAQIVDNLKALARELNVPIVCTCNCRRTRDNSEPSLADLKGSEAIEEASDVVIFIHKENNEDEDRTIFHRELIVAKNRNGETGRRSFSIPCRWL